MSKPIAPPVDTSICPFCGAATEMAPATRVYGQRFADVGDLLICGRFPKCDTYVGVHRNTTTPKGTLANAELRRWRKQAHEVFDPLWKRYDRGPRLRGLAYKRLAEILGVPLHQAHIGWCDVAQCRRIVEALSPAKAVHS